MTAKCKAEAQIEVLNSRIGDRLNSLREASGLSHQEIAVAIGATFEEVKAYEENTSIMTAAELVLLCSFLDLSVESFLKASS